MLTIVVHPDYGHPSSIWPSQELVIGSDGPYVLPSQIGMEERLGTRVLAWTAKFQEFFLAESDDFDERPRWQPGIAPFDWYDEGYQIVRKMRSEFPDVFIKPEFAQYVFSVNERRENMGLPPVRRPHEVRFGYVDISDI